MVMQLELLVEWSFYYACFYWEVLWMQLLEVWWITGRSQNVEFVALFSDETATADKRGLYVDDGQSLDITNVELY
jgi:hypothetical protein